MTEKPSDDPAKLPRAQQELDEAKDVFELLNDQLVRELPVLLEQRVPYFDPSFRGHDPHAVQSSPRRAMRSSVVSSGASPAPSAPPFISPAASLPFACGWLSYQGTLTLRPPDIQRQHTRRLRRRTARTHRLKGVLQEMRELAICGAS